MFVDAGLINGSVDNPILSNADSINVSADLDQGWHARSASLYDLSLNDIWFGGLTYHPGYWLGQIYTDNYATRGDVQLCFEVTYMGENIQSPQLEYTIFGVNVTDISQTALALNVDETPAGSAWNLLSSGYVSTPSTNCFTVDLDLGDTAYKYIGVRFRFAGTTKGRGTDYATAIDNISIDTIPEPSAIALIGLGGIIALGVVRVQRNRPNRT